MSLRSQMLALAFAAFAGTLVVHADWTAVGSTGVIDEGDLNKIVLNSDGSATIRPTISSASAKIRFNVVEAPGIGIPAPGTIFGGLTFTMRALDNGGGARVIATLKRVTLAGFFPTLPQKTDVLETIDSDLAPPSTAWQTIFAQSGVAFGDGLSFLNHGYVVEVQLIKHDASGTPGIMGVQLYRDET
jgi:hypothetical protein